MGLVALQGAGRFVGTALDAALAIVAFTVLYLVTVGRRRRATRRWQRENSNLP